MEQIIPLNEKQLMSLTTDVNDERKPFRLLAEGQAVNVVSGRCSSKGSNIFYHPVYWDRPKAFIDQVLEFMRENNPTINFTISYSE